MNYNTINISLNSSNVNGWPSIRFKLNEELLYDGQIVENKELSFNILDIPGKHRVSIERYNKTDKNIILDANEQIIADQSINLVDIKVDRIPLPDFYIFKKTEFVFGQRTDIGSRSWGPNGIWYWEFETPIITHILDVKILHDAEYNNNYIYPWSYQLGPNSVSTQSKKLDRVIKEVERVFKNEK